jgi:hypothetical protein
MKSPHDDLAPHEHSMLPLHELSALAIAIDLLRQYRQYGEAMRAQGRGFEPDCQGLTATQFLGFPEALEAHGKAVTA